MDSGLRAITNLSEVHYAEVEKLREVLASKDLEIERLRSHLKTVFDTARPSYSREEWVCFRAAKEGLNIKDEE